MNDLRTKVTDLPLLEDKEQVDTVLALGKDGKMYRIDGSNIGGGSNLTPIKCQYVNYDSYCELGIENEDLIDGLLETGGAISVFTNSGIYIENIKLNFIKKPDIGYSSLSTFSYKSDGKLLNISKSTLMYYSLAQLDLNNVLVLELHDGNKRMSSRSLETSCRYFLKFYIIKISNVQGALEELSKENMNEDSDFLRYYNSPNDIIYGCFITNSIPARNILNVFIENNSVLSQPCLVESRQGPPQE